jgi:hypothetical protein
MYPQPILPPSLYNKFKDTHTILWSTLFDTEPAVLAAQDYKFFPGNAVRGVNPETLTNVAAANALDNNQAFLVHEVTLVAGSTITAADLAKLMDGGSLRMTIGTKPMLEIPVAPVLKAGAGVPSFGLIAGYRLHAPLWIPEATKIIPSLKLRTALGVASQVQLILGGHLFIPGKA